MLQSLDALIAFIVILLTVSLLVTILVQIFSAALCLRGKSLANAVALTFQSIEPKTGNNAYKLAQRILSDPLLSDATTTTKNLRTSLSATQDKPWFALNPFNGRHLANAIRPEEIHGLLKAMGATANNPPASPPVTLPDLAATIVTQLKTLAAPPNAVAAINTAFTTALALANGQPALVNAITAANAQVTAVASRFTSEADELTRRFCSAQERAQQWFQMHTRIITIVCGVALALLFQLDSVEIFKFVSTNSTARAALVGSADKLVEKAGGILEKSGSLTEDIHAAEAKEFGTAGLSKEELGAATDTARLRSAFKTALRDKVPADFDEKYDRTEKTAIKSYYDERRHQMADLTKEVSATGFDLLPEKLGRRWESASGAGCPFQGFWSHLLGMAMTAGLLSLGAPFWYNSLRDLMSLRPAVAKQISKEEGPETKVAS